MASTLRTPLLASLEDSTEAYTHAIFQNARLEASQTAAQATAREAAAALLAALTVFRLCLAQRPGVFQDTNGELARFAHAAAEWVVERDGADDALLALLTRYL